MRLRQILFAFVFIPLGGKHYRRIFITILDFLAFKRNAGDGNTKEICCFEMKDLRDIVPVYPQLKSWLAKRTDVLPFHTVSLLDFPHGFSRKNSSENSD